MHICFFEHSWLQFFVLQVPSYVLLGIPKHEEAPPKPQPPLSPMGDACSRMDLTAIHQILVMTHYRDDEGTNEVMNSLKQVCWRLQPSDATIIIYLDIDWHSYHFKSGPNR